MYGQHKEGKYLLLYIRNYLLNKKKHQTENIYPVYINNYDNIETQKKFQKYCI